MTRGNDVGGSRVRQRYAPAHKRGQVKGQGLDFFGGEWFVLTPAGKKLEREVPGTITGGGVNDTSLH